MINKKMREQMGASDFDSTMGYKYVTEEKYYGADSLNS